ncbi:ATP-dependent endonuclease [Nocardia jiangxiensis]|uniref:ATP-dependent endonuclease n=1 Tax=Nocardia jiangxiensis TaxID=282685 RepID=A0ABW6SEA1_9NOCA
MTREPSPLFGLPVFCQHPIHRGHRTQVGALVEQPRRTILAQANITNKQVLEEAGLLITPQTFSRHLSGQLSGGPTAEEITAVVVVAARALGTTVEALLFSFPSLRKGVERHRHEAIKPIGLQPDSQSSSYTARYTRSFDRNQAPPANLEPQDVRVKRFADVLNSPARTEIKRIDIIESSLFASQSIEFNRLTAIVGAHGTGKSTLLGMLYAAFGRGLGGMPKPPIFDNDFGQSSISGVLDVTIVHEGEEATLRVDLSENPKHRAEQWSKFEDLRFPTHTSPGRMLDDLGLHTQGIQFYRSPRLSDQKNFEDLKRCVFEYSDEDLEGLRGILGRSYRTAAVFDINDADMEGVPHVEAVLKTDGRTIDSTMMSLGELWTHYLLGWETAFEDPGPLMVDEPEAYLARRGYTALIDELVRRSLESDTQTIVATHSAEVLLRFPKSHIRMCTPTSGGILVTEPSDMGKIRDALGIENILRAVVLAENELVAAIIEHLCVILDPSLIREIEIIPAGGRDGVIHGLKAVSASRRIQYRGVLAGSAHSQISTPANHSNDGVLDAILLLPGQESPEEELIRVAHRYGANLGKELGRPEADIYAALDTCEHLHERDRLARFADALDFPHLDRIVHALTKIWLGQPGAALHQAHSLIGLLRKTVESY